MNEIKKGTFGILIHRDHREGTVSVLGTHVTTRDIFASGFGSADYYEFPLRNMVLTVKEVLEDYLSNNRWAKQTFNSVVEYIDGEESWVFVYFKNV